jgi:DNA-binding MarR family transcriptional regulator
MSDLLSDVKHKTSYVVKELAYLVKEVAYMIRPGLEDPALRAWRDQTLYRLVLRASRAETTTTLRRIQELGYTDVSLTDTNLLANLDTEGTSISALARRAGVTRQAAGQQIAVLERAGYVERRSSDTDGRAAIIYQTALGRALLGDALDIVEELESQYAAQLGSARFTALKKSLSLLLDQIDPIGTLGRD